MSFPASRTKVKKLRKGKGGDIKVVKIQITSLVDMMTMILVFLLKSFSADGDILTPSKGLTLPESTAKKKPEVALRISVTQQYLLVEGKALVNLEEMMGRKELVVPELAQVLESRRTNTEKIAENSTNVTFKGDVLIEADKKTRFKVLQRIMYTCGQTGFSNFSLLVLGKES
jgi:biopolymer transport protein ExbD